PRIHNTDKANFARSIVRDRMEPYILAGDFNSVSPEDEYDRERLIRGFSSMTASYKMKENPLTIVDEILERKTVSAVLDAGLVDSYRFVHPRKDFVFTNPTGLFNRFSDTSMRLDYIFCSPDIKVIDSGIIKNKLTDMASDHYPIYAILDIPGK
ncbi:MAG: endonuclease/exonuclease/phosphatase family protein, partial [archaeon]